MTKKFNKRKIYHICRLDKFVNFLDIFLGSSGALTLILKNSYIFSNIPKKYFSS